MTEKSIKRKVRIAQRSDFNKRKGVCFMKYDTKTIENFENLSADELRAVISNMDVPDTNSNNDDVTKLKNALNKATAEASDFKKQLREQMSESDRLKAEREEADKAKDELIKSYQRKEAVGNYTTKLVALGLDLDTAKKTAESLPNDINDNFFTSLSNFKADFEKSIRADITKDTPRPGGGNTDNKISREDFAKMSYKDRLKLKSENPTEYEALKGGEDNAE